MNGYQVLFQLGDTPSRPVLEALLEALSERNRLWYLQSWIDQGNPPRSALEAGVIWRPDRPGTFAVFQDAPVVFTQKVASCGPIAAIMVGHARAQAQLSGASLEAVRARHRVVLRPLRGPNEWHAWHAVGKKLVDPTVGMRRI